MEDWKDLIDKIRSASDEIDVPEELRPEAIEMMLKKHVEEQGAGCAADEAVPKRIKRKNFKKIGRTWGGLHQNASRFRENTPNRAIPASVTLRYGYQNS